MARDKAVDSARLDTDLASVADAIRAKGGTSAQLAFPSGFVSAIGNIQTGVGYSISAVFTQGDTRVFTTDELDDLRDRLVVTAHYSDDTSEVITEYSLSGTLTAGTSTITVEALDLAATFTAVVTAATDITPSISSSSWGTGSNTTLVKNTTDKSLLVYSTSNGGYRQANHPITCREGYAYRLSADYEYFSGHAAIGLANSSGTLMINTSVTQTSGKIVIDGIPSEKSNYTESASIRLYITFNTSEAGRGVWKNIKLIEYDPTDPNEVPSILMGEETA